MVGVNVVVVRGVLSRSPEVRELAGGSHMVLLDVSTEGEGGRATVPVAWFEPSEPLPDAGAEVVVTGHVRRRFFRAGGLTQSRTEVVAAAVVPARAKAKARRAVELALADVAAGLGG